MDGDVWTRFRGLSLRFVDEPTRCARHGVDRRFRGGLPQYSVTEQAPQMHPLQLGPAGSLSPLLGLSASPSPLGRNTSDIIGSDPDSTLDHPQSQNALLTPSHKFHCQCHVDTYQGQWGDEICEGIPASSVQLRLSVSLAVCVQLCTDSTPLRSCTLASLVSRLVRLT